jgi:hypothetical protein
MINEVVEKVRREYDRRINELENDLNNMNEENL